jgi:hypothetical protein
VHIKQGHRPPALSLPPPTDLKYNLGSTVQHRHFLGVSNQPRDAVCPQHDSLGGWIVGFSPRHPSQRFQTGHFRSLKVLRHCIQKHHSRLYSNGFPPRRNMLAGMPQWTGSSDGTCGGCVSQRKHSFQLYNQHISRGKRCSSLMQRRSRHNHYRYYDDQCDDKARATSNHQHDCHRIDFSWLLHHHHRRSRLGDN